MDPRPTEPAARPPAAAKAPAPAGAALARWLGLCAAAGVAVGIAEAAGMGGIATLLLPGLAIGLAQRLAAPRRLPALWTLFSGLAWVAGVLLDATVTLRPVGVGLWLVPTATMALWQTFLLHDLRRAWPWLPVSLLAAVALQATAQATCAVVCAPLAGSVGPWSATLASYLAGFAGYGLVTGLAFPYLSRPARR